MIVSLLASVDLFELFSHPSSYFGEFYVIKQTEQIARVGKIKLSDGSIFVILIGETNSKITVRKRGKIAV